jgi:hypothetical protein
MLCCPRVVAVAMASCKLLNPTPQLSKLVTVAITCLATEPIELRGHY